MTPTSASPVQPPVLPDQEELIRRLLSDTPLLKDTPDHLLEVVNVLESYGLVLDAYSKNLVDQGEQQMLNPFPVFRFFHEGFNLKRLWTHLRGIASTLSTPSTARRRCSGMAPAGWMPTSTRLSSPRPASGSSSASRRGTLCWPSTTAFIPISPPRPSVRSPRFIASVCSGA